jgi:hypothetical protein
MELTHSAVKVMMIRYNEAGKASIKVEGLTLIGTTACRRVHPKIA